MDRIGLIPYELTIQRRRRKESYVDLRNFGGGDSARYFLLSFLAYLKDRSYEIDHGNTRTFELLDFTEDNNSIFGTILSGKYGEYASFRNVDTQQINYVRRPDDAEVKSFFFYIELPESQEIAGSCLTSFRARAMTCSMAPRGQKMETVWLDTVSITV